MRAAFKVLGFKPRHVASILRLLAAILALGNLDFAEHPEDPYDFQSDPAWVTNRDVLDHAASLLGVASDDLERALTNRVRWVRKEMTASILRAEGADQQRDSLMAALYSILFAFVVETANHKLFPGDEAIATLQRQGGASILHFNSPGFANHSPSRPGSRSSLLVRALDGFDDFVHNYQVELQRYWGTEQAFDGDAGIAARAQEDGVRIGDVLPSDDGTARIELLRGGRLGGKADRKPGGIVGGLAKTVASLRKGAQPHEANDELLAGMRDHFGTHGSFVAHPGGPGARTSFAVTHYGHQTVTYDGHGFVETDADALDPEFVALLRNAADPFVAKLVSGPSLAAEVHPLDDNTIVAAQVSSMPLRQPSTVKVSRAFVETEKDGAGERGDDYTAPLLDPLAIHPVSAQVNATAAHLLGSILARTQQWSVLAILPNTTGASAQIDARLVKAQVAALQLPELAARRNRVDWTYDAELADFLLRHGVGVGATESTHDAADAFLRDFGLSSARGDYALGNARVWLCYRAFKALEDRLRQHEPPEHREAALAAAREAGAGGGVRSVPPLTVRTTGDDDEKEYDGDDAAVPGSPGMLGYMPDLGPSRSTVNVGYAEGGDRGGGDAGESVEDLLYNGAAPGTTATTTPGYVPYTPTGLGATNAFDTVRSGLGGYGSQPSLQPPTAPYMRHGGSGYGSGAFGYAGGGGGMGHGASESQIWGNDKATPAGFGAPPPGALGGGGTGGGYGNGGGGKEGVLDRDGNPQEGEGKAIEEVPTSRARRIWVGLVWALTWWVPTPALTYIGRMKRHDVRMAWREKVHLRRRCLARTSITRLTSFDTHPAARALHAHLLLLRRRHLLCVDVRSAHARSLD